MTKSLGTTKERRIYKVYEEKDTDYAVSRNDFLRLG